MKCFMWELHTSLCRPPSFTLLYFISVLTQFTMLSFPPPPFFLLPYSNLQTCSTRRHDSSMGDTSTLLLLSLSLSPIFLSLSFPHDTTQLLYRWYQWHHWRYANISAAKAFENETHTLARSHTKSPAALSGFCWNCVGMFIQSFPLLSLPPSSPPLSYHLLVVSSTSPIPPPPPQEKPYNAFLAFQVFP